MKYLETFENWDINEAKLIDKAPELNCGSLIQIVNDDDENCDNAKIIKCLKTLYHIKYKSETYKVKKSDVNINIHAQAQTEIKKLIKK